MKQQQNQSHLGKDDSQRFINEEAKERFESKIKLRKFHMEKGFLMQDIEHYGLPPHIAETIDAHHWGSLLSTLLIQLSLWLGRFMPTF